MTHRSEDKEAATAASLLIDNTQAPEDSATEADRDWEGIPEVAAQPTTVGTGSYIAVSCVAMMVLLTLLLIAGLLASRWLF